MQCLLHQFKIVRPFLSTFAFNRRWMTTTNVQTQTQTQLKSSLTCKRQALWSKSSSFNSFFLLRNFQSVRHFNTKSNEAKRLRSAAFYFSSTLLLMLGASYAGVPLYRMFCQTTGLGGELKRVHDSSKVETMKPIKDRIIRIRFNADIAASMQWNFRPHQPEIKVLPGETALAFYRAKNPTDVPIVGISTYNVVPFEAGPYFNKIQCFCFEEQRLNPHEEVDMPVFFYIDPEFCDDPKMEKVDIITLSYTFFEAKEGMTLPLPKYMTSHTI